MTMPNSTTTDYGTRWRLALAPRTGDIRRDLTMEAAEHLGMTVEEADRRVDASSTDFPDEWNRLVTDPSDPEQVVRFYNESRSELFEQIAWHACEPLHHRSPVSVDLASTKPGREFLDFGSGIGSNALMFGLAGFNVTLADVADPLRNFALWRCQRRGIPTRAIDLKHQSLEPGRYDVITCFDVLEHIPNPLASLRQIRNALRPGGLLFLFAPFGHDPIRPMHIVHDDAVLRHVRSLGFNRKYEWERVFPSYPHHPTPYERVERSALVNQAYFVRDVWLNGPLTDSIVKAARVVTGGFKSANHGGAHVGA